MTMSVTSLRTYWDAGDAYTVITFLDELRDLLWEQYEDQIIEMHQEAVTSYCDEDQLEFDFGEQILF